MTWSEAALEALALRLSQRCDPLPELERRVVLAILRELANGRPARLGALSSSTGLSLPELSGVTENLPGKVRDEEGSIVALGGLSLNRTPYAMRVRAGVVYAWCAWDTLFLPELIKARARVESTCTLTQSPVRVEVGTELERVSPGETVLSFPESERCNPSGGCGPDAFCRHVRFLESIDAWAAWSRSHSQPTFSLTVAQAHLLGRIWTRLHFGDG